MTINNGVIALTQCYYIEKLWKKFNYFDVSPVFNPPDPSVSVQKNKGANISQYKYSQLVGSLMHLMNHTRPGIA